ncbi:hypothetical protein Zmor_027440 [Zophobas morio]|uniref:Uncharacterized protein n=1 Tax=Zophobas morio TaxID=2755281 RepID=A0AA38HQP5_9CUCU|nr:hypothetical protein Zmor_027440 [Zophobas morio]
MPEYERLEGEGGCGASWRALTSLEKKLMFLMSRAGTHNYHFTSDSHHPKIFIFVRPYDHSIFIFFKPYDHSIFIFFRPYDHSIFIFFRPYDHSIFNFFNEFFVSNGTDDSEYFIFHQWCFFYARVIVCVYGFQVFLFNTMRV